MCGRARSACSCDSHMTPRDGVTARELAKDLNMCCRHSPTTRCFECSLRLISEALKAAREEAYAQFKKDYRWACQCKNVDCELEAEIISRGAARLEEKGRIEGRDAGLEEAARVVEKHKEWCIGNAHTCDVENDIRKLKRGVS